MVGISAIKQSQLSHFSLPCIKTSVSPLTNPDLYVNYPTGDRTGEAAPAPTLPCVTSLICRCLPTGSEIKPIEIELLLKYRQLWTHKMKLISL